MPPPVVSRPGGMRMGGAAAAMGVLGRADHAAISVDPKMPDPIEASSSSLAGDQKVRWQPASKRITSMEDLKRFQNSCSLRSFLEFVLFLNQSVQGMKATGAGEASEAIQKLRGLLALLAKWVDE